MMSPILTKINKTPLAFKDRIFLKVQLNDERLKQFVRHCHPTGEFNQKDDSITVYTSKGMYLYHSLGTYFERIDLNTTNRVYYKVS